MTQSRRRNQFPHIWDFPTEAKGQHSTSVTRHGHRQRAQTQALESSVQINMCVYPHMFMKEGGERCWVRVWPKTSAESVPKVSLCVRSKTCPAKTNKWVSRRRENILKLIDVSSLCICYYFHCIGPPEAKSSSSHNDPRCDNTHLYCASGFSSGAERIGAAVADVFTSLVIHVKGGQNLVAMLPPWLFLWSTDRDGIVCWLQPCQSLSVKMDTLFTTLTSSTLIRYFVFCSCYPKSVKGKVNMMDRG